VAVTVSRETLEAVLARFDAPNTAAPALDRLLVALEAEPDPPTTVRAPDQALDVHIADSLAGLEVPELRLAAAIADLGAGAGFPGLVLAAALEHAHVDLIESARRKCDVIDRLASAAALETRARARPARAEEWAALPERRESYDAVTARALAPLAVICEYAAPLLRVGGVLVAWKGARDTEEEVAGAHAATQLGLGAPRVVPVRPYEGSRNRHLHVYVKLTATAARYPRRPGMAAKRPLA
jgi:16S rRNA (guanine527-N7)-methyltransferase